MPLRLGRFALHEVRDGAFRLDGGAMFGIVPRVLWERTNPPDALNRIELSLRCLLIDTGDRKILVDCGIGNKMGAKQREQVSIDRSRCHLDSELARAGVRREEITDVILTHLHLDHAGGAVRRGEDGRLALGFPAATYHLQRRNWRWAHQPSEKDRASYLREDFELLERTGRLHLIEGEIELYEGVQIFVSEGHTIAMQLVRVQGDGQEVVFCGDLIPTTSHLRPPYVTGYDLYPLTAIEEKKLLLAQAVEDGALLFFSHDPRIAACPVKDVEGRVEAGEPVVF